MSALEILDTVVKLVTLLVIVGGGGMTLFRLGRMTQKFEGMASRQAEEIGELKVEMQKVENVLVAMASQSGRMDRIEDRLGLQGQRVDTLSMRFNALVDKSAIRPLDPMERA